MRGPRTFCQFYMYLVLNLFYTLQRGSNGFIAETNFTYILPESREVHYFPGEGVQLLPGAGGGEGSKC